MATYRLFPSTNGPASPTPTTGPWLLGVMFSALTEMLWLNGYYFWVPTGGDTGSQKFALWNRYNTMSENLVPDSVVTSGTLTANSWNYVALSSPVQLAPGALYVAATGWTAVNGIPMTSNQFGIGEPFSAGIVNGPLTAWSAYTGSNTFPAGTANYGLGQMLFSDLMGADPSVAMPTSGSEDENWWMDVLVSTTPPSGYTGSYRFWPNMTDLGNYTLSTASNFTLGLQFAVSQACSIGNIWFYSPPTVTQLPTAIGVYQVSGPVLVASSSSPSWTGAAGSGWISAPLSGTLQAGVNYKAVVLNGAGSPAVWNAEVASYWSTGFGASGLAAGPLTAPDNASAVAPGQESYNAGATLAYPGTSAGPYHYGVDIEVTPQVTPVPALYMMRRFR